MSGFGSFDGEGRLLPLYGGPCNSCGDVLSWAVYVLSGECLMFPSSWQGNAHAVALVPWRCCSLAVSVHACVRFGEVLREGASGLAGRERRLPQA